MINKYSVLNGAKYFYSGIPQKYLVFIPAKKGIKYLSGTTRIYLSKSNRMSEKNIENITKSDSNFAPAYVSYHVLPDINFNGHCLINNIISVLKKVINLYISYIVNPWLRCLNTEFTLNNYLFGSVKLTENADLDKYKYSSYGLGFDSPSDESMGKNIIIFGAGVSSSMHIDDKDKDILIPGEGLTQELDDTTLTTEAKYPINFT